MVIARDISCGNMQALARIQQDFKNYIMHAKLMFFSSGSLSRHLNWLCYCLQLYNATLLLYVHDQL